MKGFILGASAALTASALIGQKAAPPLAVPSPAAPPSRTAAIPAELELQVGKTTYPVRVNQLLTITTPRGEKVDLVVRRKDVLRYQGAGVSFNYPRQMQASVDETEGVTTITVEGVNSALALVQVFTVPTTPELVRKQLASSFRGEFQKRGGKALPAKPARRRIGGVERRGEQLEWSLAGRKLRSEIYAFKQNERVMAVVFQRSADDETAARRYFAIISDSLK